MNKPFSWKVLLIIAVVCYSLKFVINGVAIDALFEIVGLICLVSGIVGFIKHLRSKKINKSVDDIK